jgi:hypothetical protein
MTIYDNAEEREQMFLDMDDLVYEGPKQESPQEEMLWIS